VPKRLIEAQIFDWLKSIVRQASHPNNYLLKISRQSMIVPMVQKN